MLSLVVTALAFEGPRHFPERDVPAYSEATSSWVRGAKPPPHQTITLAVALHIDQGRRDELEKVFWAVSDPKSSSYGEHKSLAEIGELLQVPAERVSRVSRFFKAHGATVKVEPAKDALTVTIPVRGAEAALATTLHTFTHRDNARVTLVRASAAYSLPSEFAADVAYVGDLLQFPALRSVRAAEPEEEEAAAAVASGVEDAWPSDCSGCSKMQKEVTPAVLKQRYKVTGDDAPNPAGNTMAVAEFQGQFFREADLEAFASSCATPCDVVDVIGKNQSGAGVEAELDIEYIKAMAPKVPLTVVYDGSYSLLNWMNQVIGLSSPPLVSSVSYGNDERQQSSTAYMDSCNVAFQKAGVMGLSVLFASGDQGVCGRSGCGLFVKKFKPDFPAASPFITAVGGTDFKTPGTIGDETAWPDSGGGFSNTFGIPSYQASAVASFLADSAKGGTLPAAKLFNSTGRGYPDVSALGGQKNSYCVRTGGRWGGVAGTSASSPVVAGVFARLNGLRLAAGKKPMGFLNPFIYQNPAAFQDVTSGKNNYNQKDGFTAIVGWDAATGYGTPDYSALAKLV